MKKPVLLFLFLFAFLTIFCQESVPEWLSKSSRELRYPNEIYFTGFVFNFVEQDKSLQQYIENVKTEAQAELVKQIRLKIEAKTQSKIFSQNANGNYSESEIFLSEATTTADAEIVGIKTETHYDKTENKIYAFAYANKYEIMGYYKSNLSMNLNQIESFVKTAKDLENNGEKAKARQQLEMAKPLFSKTRSAQEMLVTLDGNATPDDLQQSKTELLYNTVTQLQAKLAQGVYVYVESNENLFGQKVDIVANKVKAELAINGCSFVNNANDADLLLNINVSTRISSQENSIVFCYADTTVELYDNHKQKMVYSDEIAQKGGANTQDKAGRQAMNDVAKKVVEKLKNWIQ